MRVSPCCVRVRVYVCAHVVCSVCEAATRFLETLPSSVQVLALERLRAHCDEGVVTLATSPRVLRMALHHPSVQSVCVLAYPWDSADPSVVMAPAVQMLRAVLAGNQGTVACIVCEAAVLRDSGACGAGSCGSLVLFDRGRLLCPDMVAARACPQPPSRLSARLEPEVCGSAVHGVGVEAPVVPVAHSLAAGQHHAAGAPASVPAGFCQCRIVLTWAWRPSELTASACAWEVVVKTTRLQDSEQAAGADAEGEAASSVVVVHHAVVSVECADTGALAADLHRHGAQVTVPATGTSSWDCLGPGPTLLKLEHGQTYLCSVRAVRKYLATTLLSAWEGVALPT